MPFSFVERTSLFSEKAPGSSVPQAETPLPGGFHKQHRLIAPSIAPSSLAPSSPTIPLSLSLPLPLLGLAPCWRRASSLSPRRLPARLCLFLTSAICRRSPIVVLLFLQRLPLAHRPSELLIYPFSAPSLWTTKFLQFIYSSATLILSGHLRLFHGQSAYFASNLGGIAASLILSSLAFSSHHLSCSVLFFRYKKHRPTL